MKRLMIFAIAALSALYAYGQCDCQNSTAIDLVKNGHFRFVFERVIHSEEIDASRFYPRGEFTVCDSVACGELPFFGRVYRVTQPGKSEGIKFNGKILNPEFKMVEKKRKKKNFKCADYSFSVKGENDTYSIYMTVYENGSCSLNVNSNDRSAISYMGRIECPCRADTE